MGSTQPAADNNFSLNGNVIKPRRRPSEVNNAPTVDLKTLLPGTWLFDLQKLDQNGEWNSDDMQMTKTLQIIDNDAKSNDRK